MAKIVIVNRYFYPDHSATSQFLTDLAFFVAAGMREVHVVTSQQRYDDPEALLAAEETAAGVRVHRVWTTSFGRSRLAGRALDYLTFYVSTAWRLACLLGTGDVVVAKTDPPLLSLVVAPVARLRGARLVNWLQDVFPEVAAAAGMKMLGGGAGALLTWLRDASLRSAACNVVLGERTRSYLTRRGIPGKRIRVIENWADGALIVPVPAAENALRAEWGMAGKVVVGYSGNMGRAHEFGTILDAAERLRERVDIVFLFIGGGKHRELIEREAARRELAGVQFRPYQPREGLAESLSVPDVHLISLRPAMEGLVVPSKFYGIAAAGRPAIFVGAREGEIAEKLRRYDCGVAVEQGDAEGLAAAIRTLADDAGLREEMGRNARAAFEEHWEKRIACGKWLRLIEQMQGSRDKVQGDTEAGFPPPA
jgi:glycosyltransferase involved in cell wall biosynthesis